MKISQNSVDGFSNPPVNKFDFIGKRLMGIKNILFTLKWIYPDVYIGTHIQINTRTAKLSASICFLWRKFHNNDASFGQGLVIYSKIITQFTYKFPGCHFGYCIFAMNNRDPFLASGANHAQPQYLFHMLVS